MNTDDGDTDRETGVIGPDEQEALKRLRASDRYRSLAVRQLAERLSQADPSDVQKIAASQIRLLDQYNQVVLDQARKSFWIAAPAAVFGLLLFASAVGLLLLEGAGDAAIIAAVSGAIAEVVSGIGFYLYAKASGQLAEFQIRLDRTQRFLLANSICSSLKGAARDKARTELIRAIAGLSLLLPESERGPAAESMEEGEEA